MEMFSPIQKWIIVSLILVITLTTTNFATEKTPEIVGVIPSDENIFIGDCTTNSYTPFSFFSSVQLPTSPKGSNLVYMDIVFSHDFKDFSDFSLAEKKDVLLQAIEIRHTFKKPYQLKSLKDWEIIGARPGNDAFTPYLLPSSNNIIRIFLPDPSNLDYYLLINFKKPGLLFGDDAQNFNQEQNCILLKVD